MFEQIKWYHILLLLLIIVIIIAFGFGGFGGGFSTGNQNNIAKINKLYDEGNEITYWTARGTVTGFNWFKVTQQQLSKWGCKYHHLSVGYKPAYDLLICDKTKRIEEI